MPKKELGQHWLTDRAILHEIVADAHLQPVDTVLEIGPGLGTLTSVLLAQASRVVAVEYDEDLAAKLPKQFPGKDLQVIRQDFLTFDLGELPASYKVVANVPYYITAKIVAHLTNAANRPHTAVLLVQKEVAERMAATPGDMSLLALNAQVAAEVSLGVVVDRSYFNPEPRVDSQVVILEFRDQPAVPIELEKSFWRVAKAGFSAKRKKLRSSLSAGLALSKQDTEQLLATASIDPDLRAEALSIDDWIRIATALQEVDS